MIVFRRVLASIFAQPLGAAQAATKGLLAFVGVTRNALGLVDEMLLIPVIVVDVGAVETLDHFGGAGASFDGLEDAEGDQGAAANLYLRASPAPYWITFAPPASRRHAIAPPAPDYIAIVALMPPPSLSSSFWVAEQNTAGTAASARACSHCPRVTPR